MPSFAPCLHKEADAKIFAHATEAAKRQNKKISSCAVYTAIVVLVIPVTSVVQQLCVDELWGWQKSPAVVDVKSSCLAFLFTHRVQ